MEKINKSHLDQVILELSKDTAFFKNEQKRFKKLQKTLDLQKSKNQDVKLNQHKKNKIVESLEKLRTFEKIIVHFDMDMFFAAVAIRDNPLLKNKPVAVGNEAMISTASYEARKFGVRSGMPGFIAKKLCPNLIFVKSDFKAYKDASDKVRIILKKYDPNFNAVGLDEALLNLTDHCEKKNINFDRADKVVEEIRKNIFRETKLTASAGIASNGLLAKIASDKNKPNGQCVVPRNKEGITAFLAPLTIRKIPGIGKVTEHILHQLGIKTCGDLLQKGEKLFIHFKESSVQFMLSSALGISHYNEKKEKKSRKSISTERFFQPVKETREIEMKLREVMGILMERFSQTELKAKTITVKLKKVDFDQIVRSKTMNHFVSKFDEIFPIVMEIIRAELPLTLRAIGVKLSTLKKQSEMIKFGRKDEGKGEESKRKKNPKIKLDFDFVEKKAKKAKQSKLDGFREEKDYFCPKCGAFFYGLFSLNGHLDRCLER